MITISTKYDIGDITEEGEIISIMIHYHNIALNGHPTHIQYQVNPIEKNGKWTWYYEHALHELSCKQQRKQRKLIKKRNNG